MEYSYLSDIINSDAEDWSVRVRVCRLWEAVNTKDNNLISMDMILADEKGNLMHAVVRRHLVPRFRTRVSEGLVYGLRNVKVTTNTYQYRPLADNQKLLFLATTEVLEIGDDVVHIPKFGFQFVNLPVLQSRADDVTTLSDIIGCYCGFGEVEVVGSGSKKRDIKIFTDYSITSTVTLWGKLGEMFDPSLYAGDDAPYVIVVSAVTVKTYQGSLTFATTSASKLYVNPEVAHVSSIRERFSVLPPKIVAIEGPSVAKLPPEEAMFINRMTVEALVRATCAGELKADVVTLKAAITAINNRFGWCYVSCKTCVKKASPRDGVFYCKNCNGPVGHPLVMFGINVQVKDSTGTTTVVLFNSVAERLLDTSANKLFNKMPAGDTSIPAELQTLLGKEFVLKLKLNKYNLVDGLQDYGVSAVFTPMEELESAYEKEALAPPASDLAGSSSAGGNVLAGGSDRKRKLDHVTEAAPGGGSAAP